MHFEAGDSISGESLCLTGEVISLLNVACAMNNGMQCRQKIKTHRDVIVSQFSFYRLLCCPCALGHDRLLYMGTGANPATDWHPI